jgi:hypothetical protein
MLRNEMKGAVVPVTSFLDAQKLIWFRKISGRVGGKGGGGSRWEK